MVEAATEDRASPVRAGILTFHDGLNHGAYLQCFATVELLRSLGCDAAVIGYKNRRHRWMQDVAPWFRYRRPVRFLDHAAKGSAFRRAWGRLPLTRRVGDAGAIRALGLDLAVVGSDVVWDPTIFGYDDLYFGGVPARRRISYAASFGTVREGDDLGFDLGAALARFDGVSVRDETSRILVERATGVSPAVVADPTLAADLSRFAERTGRIERAGRYLLVYGYCFGEEDAAAATAFARERGLRTVAAGYRQGWCDENWMDAGPFEWMALFAGAEAVFTTTFHGTLFAAMSGKPFAAVANRQALGKISRFLEAAGMPERLAGGEAIRPLLDASPDPARWAGYRGRVRDFSVGWLREQVGRCRG